MLKPFLNTVLIAGIFGFFFYSAVCGLVWSFCPSSTLTQSAGSDCCPHVGNTQFWGFVRAELTNPTLAAVHSCPSELWGEGQCPCLPLAPPQRLCKSHYCFNLPLQDQCCSVPGTGPGPPGQGMGVVPPPALCMSVQPPTAWQSPLCLFWKHGDLNVETFLDCFAPSPPIRSSSPFCPNLCPLCPPRGAPPDPHPPILCPHLNGARRAVEFTDCLFNCPTRFGFNCPTR